MHTSCYNLDAITPTKGPWPPKYYPKWPTSVFLVYCGQTTVASPVCCCVWMRTLAVNHLCIRWPRCKLGYRAPEHTYQATEPVRNRIITPLGGRHQRRLVVYAQTSSGIKCRPTPLSGSFGQIGYDYKLQDSGKMCAPVPKCHQFQEASRSWPPPGLCPLDPNWGLCPQTPIICCDAPARM